MLPLLIPQVLLLILLLQLLLLQCVFYNLLVGEFICAWSCLSSFVGACYNLNLLLSRDVLWLACCSWMLLPQFQDVTQSMLCVQCLSLHWYHHPADSWSYRCLVRRHRCMSARVLFLGLLTTHLVATMTSCNVKHHEVACAFKATSATQWTHTHNHEDTHVYASVW